MTERSTFGTEHPPPPSLFLAYTHRTAHGTAHGAAHGEAHKIAYMQQPICMVNILLWHDAIDPITKPAKPRLHYTI